jgi:uncharacterized protein GlcG (DUF336 family)
MRCRALKRTVTVLGSVALALGAIGAAIVALPGSAASPTNTSPVSAHPIVSQKVISVALAQRLANAAMNNCANRGFPVSVAVVDPDGIDIVVQRADGATGATVAVARDKAHASAGFQSPTSGLSDAAKTNPGLIAVRDFSILPGGEPIRSGKSLVGGVGVSGAPSGDIDDLCAKAGLRAIAGSL